jgi:innexin
MHEDDPIKHHAYYQWVPCVLFLQALMFHLPHVIWRSWENGKIKALVDGLAAVELSKFNRKIEDRKLGNVNLLSSLAVDGRVSRKLAYLFSNEL